MFFIFFHHRADIKKVLRDTLDVAPFALCDPDNPSNLVLVTEATEAEGLLEDLEVTHNQFIPTKTSAMQAGIDRIFGEVRSKMMSPVFNSTSSGR